MLHIITKSPFQSDAFNSCLRLSQNQDVILFVEDGVIAALKNTIFSDLVIARMNQTKIFALAPDLVARGLMDQVLAAIELVDYEGFVDLTIQYSPIQTWS